MSKIPARRPYDCKLLAAGGKRVRAFAQRIEAADPAHAATDYVRGLFAASDAELHVPHDVEVTHPSGTWTEWTITLLVTARVQGARLPARKKDAAPRGKEVPDAPAAA